jgi:two-component system chemotaxis sensor kinase CheA
LISNAVVHGIEETEDRLEKGKHSVGTISIHAENDDTSIIISIEDDGVGLDAEEIKKTALSLGLTSEKILEGRKDEECFDLLTLPGYTTKEFGEDFCPEAMGLNAIKQRVEAKGGRFEIQGEKNRGSYFRVILPTNLAIKRVKRVLLFGVGKEIYATPASLVHMVVNMDQHPIKTKIEDIPYIKFRENVIPFYNLSTELDIESMNGEQFGIILKKEDEECCVSVSQIIGFEGVAIKSAQDLSLNFKGIMGLTVLSDGRATPILDLWSIVHD